MTAEVITLADKRPSQQEQPHLSGQAICTTCGHEWVAVAPVGTTHLDCPSCTRMQGVFKNAVEPEVAWACACNGNQLFFLTRSGAMCRSCGAISSAWANE